MQAQQEQASGKLQHAQAALAQRQASENASGTELAAAQEKQRQLQECLTAARHEAATAQV